MYHSYWEKTVFLQNYDYLILGSGIVGLSTALSLKRKKPDAKVVIVERGYLPSGASTKNAGFACFGSISELLKHERSEGTESMLKLVKLRYEGLSELRKNVPDSEMDYYHNGGFEVFIEKDSEVFEESIANIDRINTLLKDVIGIEKTFSLRNDLIQKTGMKSINNIIYNSGEGQLNPGLMIKSLLMQVQKLGVTFINGIEINLIENEESSVKLIAKSGTFIQGKKLIVTSNAFSKKLLPELEIVPGRGQIVLTSIIPNLKIEGCYHYDEGYYYFRNLDGRILLGGGRNLNFKAEETSEFGFTETVQSKLEELLKMVILPKINFNIEYRWSGIMGFGSEIEPIIKQVRSGVFCAVRMSGMGIAIGSIVGKNVTELVLENE